MCSFCGKQGIIELPIQVGDSIATICQDCVNQMASMMDSIVENAEEAEEKEELVVMTPSQIKAELDKYVIGQEKAKKALAVGVYNHLKRIVNNRLDIQKSNIFLLGNFFSIILRAFEYLITSS